MVTLAELRDGVFPAAKADAVGSGARSAQADVGWVRVMRARVPAFDALDPDDLVIVPAAALAVVAGDSVASTALVDALLAARVAGVLVVGDGPGADAFAAAVGAAGLATYTLVDGEPGAVERSAIGYLVNRRAELERLAGELERRLEAAAVAGRGLDALVGELARTLGRTVALEDRRGVAVAVHAPPGAGAAEAARYAGGSRDDAELRVRLPAAEGAPGSGWLVLPGAAEPTELERLAADRAAPVLALAMARDDALRTARDAARRDTLPGAGPPWVVVVARQSGDSFATRDAREALRRDVRLLAPARRLALRGDAESLELRVILAGDDADPSADDLTSRLGELVGGLVARSRPFVDPAERAPAEAEARATLEAVEQLDGRVAGARIAEADRLAAYRLLVGLHNVPDGRRQAEALLAPLRAGSARAAAERLRTLRTVLREPGAAEAAAALGVHRNTLAYRVRRIEALSGWRVADPDLRLPLLAALELVQDD